ncbi:hypothetical protein M8B98_22985, partial [Enterobacter hormaechei subsp. hoffmannii]|nr:hypothetical protein [Enterobacter hormaechei subsp. hoffmannii]MCW4780044.1 hypothetical protein [Enterobacter hormaechei subsp. hoffmannii]
MKLKTLTSLIVTTYICFNSVAQASAPQPVFTPTQEARIGEIAAEYLVSHPEVLVAGVVSENGIYGHSRFCNTDFDDKLAC